jgi:uncharacterized protein YbjT (DUF2867 family)
MVRLVVFGASGETGRQIVSLGVKHGHDVVGVVRRSNVDFEANVECVVLPELTPESLGTVLRAGDVVLSALGLRRKSRNPWSAPASPNDFLSKSTDAIVAAARVHGTRRIVYCSAYGVGELHTIPPIARAIVRWSNIHLAYLDHAIAERLLAESGLAYTIVKPSMLVDEASAAPAKIVPRALSSWSKVSRAAVADFMLRAAFATDLENRSVTVES